MERKPMSKKEQTKFAAGATNDEEQELWEMKKLGTDSAHVLRNDSYKPPSKLISIRVPEDVLGQLKGLADSEGLRYQTYIISLLKKHVKKILKN